MSVKVLSGLLARLEAAEGADRELDFDLERLGLKGDGWFREDRTSQLRDPRWAKPEPDGRTFVHGVAHRYTASLDAALALVERTGAAEGIDAAQLLREALEHLVNGGWRADQPIAPQIANRLLMALVRTLITIPNTRANDRTREGEHG